MAMQQIHQWLLKIFGSRNERLVRSYMRVAQAAGALEASIQALSDEQLKAKTGEFKQRLADGQKPQDILPEAFAVVREAARRTLNMRHFDVQLVGGNVLYDAKIAEMATGEGKTLVATLAAYLAHLAGRKVHIVTVNDYLAKRDADWMGPVYRALGLTVGAIQADMDTVGQVRREQYECDITYGTNNEFGFDYLRDNMKISVEQMVQGPLDYAIIDEVDSILIDEARTPLIISGPAQDDISRYKKADAIARHLMSLQSTYDRLKKQIDQLQRDIANAQGELADAKRAKDDARVQRAQKAIDHMTAQLADAQRRLAAELQGTEDQIEENTLYYNVDYERRSVHLMEKGIAAAQAFAGIGSFYLGQNTEWPHLIEQALRAHLVFEKEKHYVVMDGKVIIVDEFTGRLMHGRQWSDGLHQAVEAKEGVPIKEETQTLATITLQNFFKLYNRIAGMTGTAATEAEEFMKIYNLDVVSVPPNKPCIRIDKDDLIYKTMREKFNAIVEEIHTVCTSGRPVLVGTVSIEKSEALSEALKRRYGIEHEVLNAKQHAREALIVEKAGQQHTARDGSIRGNVTIATNMAGRGTDIKLGPGVAAIGGLHIVGTERHEARRIDNQLRGRAGRQGDPGSSVFFLSFDDDLLRIFAPDWTVKALTLIGWQEGEPIQHRRISKGIEKAQKKVEQRNFEIRKSLLEYDEVMDYQRKIFYARRRKVIEGKDLKQTIWQMIEHTVQTAADKMLSQDYPYQSICEWAATEFGVELDIKRIRGMDGEWIAEQIRQQAKKNIANQIPLALGEYLEDYEDKSTWAVDALCRWAMSAFSVHLTAGKVRQMTAEEVETELIEAACQQVDKKPMAALEQFLKPDFGAVMFSRWAAGKFDLKLDPAQLITQSPAQVVNAVLTELDQKYTAREIEYPVEFAMNIVLSQPTPTVYAFQTLADWAKRRYDCDLTAEQIAASSPKDIHQKLIELSRQWHTERLEKTVKEKIAQLSPAALAEWANQRFEARLTPDQLTDPQQAAQILMDVGRQFLRRELAELERFVLTQIYDQVWKDHLYAMDHLKESIMLRAYAERDPKIEYKHEGFKMFQQMLETIEDRVTDIIFRVRLAVGVQQRSVYRAAQTQKQDVSQFETAQRQRAAAMAPQGETVTKPIKLEKPKVGRNDPCPCGSGKKYKKCCAGKQ